MTKLEKDFIRAASKGDLTKLKEIFAIDVNVNAKDSFDFTALIYASRKGHLEIVKALNDMGADLELPDIRKRTPFFHAVTYLRYDVVSFLAELKCNINTVDTHFCTPLDFATISHNLKMVKLLNTLGAATYKEMAAANNA